MSELYSSYSKKSLAVFVPREKYEAQIKSIGGRWYKSLRSGHPGWLVPKSNEEKLKEIIADEPVPFVENPPAPVPSQPSYPQPVTASEQPPSNPQPKPAPEQPTSPRHERLYRIKKHARPRHEQDRYHRSVSASRKYQPTPSPTPPPSLTRYTEYRRTPDYSRDYDSRDETRLRPRSPSYSERSDRSYRPHDRRRKRRHKYESRSPYSVREEMRRLESRMRELQRKMRY